MFVGLEERLGFRHQAAFLEKAEARVRLTPEHEVGRDRERFDKAEVLVDDRDPRFPRFAGLLKATGLPSISIAPASKLWTPLRILMSVDLPAPFSPSSA